MRIQYIKIDRWRNFQGIEFSPPESAPIICLVGANGTGKSQILELISACAQRIGLTPGNETSRADPFSEDASFAVKFLISPNTILTIDNSDFPESLKREYEAWDRTLIVASGAASGKLSAGGVQSGVAEHFANLVIQRIRNSASIHYLKLDSDRAYPKVDVPPHQIGDAIARDWEITNKQSSFRLTRNLYEEWFRYMFGRENQENNRYVQKIRLARETGAFEPKFVDQFESYKEAVQKILPHLLFLGVDTQNKEIRFDSTGTELSFHQLSGGEREITFLISQIDRFALKKGLLLVDEPELHLNYDLLRSWIGFLKDSVEEGQIWLATHALEVVEVTGQEATFILERAEQTRHIIATYPLSSQPIIATLSRALGSAAFSISNLSFVLIEGEEEIGERERFRLLCNVPSHVRFLESGDCKEVIRRVSTLQFLAATSGQNIRVGGIIDGDWRPKQEREELEKKGLFVLGVHEVENFFLNPATLKELMVSIGGEPTEVEALITRAADRRAGAWIFDSARTNRLFRDYPEPPKAVRELVHTIRWENFSAAEGKCEEIAGAYDELNAEQQDKLKKHLIASARSYNRKRENGDLWRACEGKQIFRALVLQLGFADEDAAERAITAVWKRRPDLVPVELAELRDYVNAL